MNHLSIRETVYSIGYHSLFVYIPVYYCTYLYSFSSSLPILKRSFSGLILKTEHRDRIESSSFQKEANSYPLQIRPQIIDLFHRID